VSSHGCFIVLSQSGVSVEYEVVDWLPVVGVIVLVPSNLRLTGVAEEGKRLLTSWLIEEVGAVIFGMVTPVLVAVAVDALPCCRSWGHDIPLWRSFFLYREVGAVILGVGTIVVFLVVFFSFFCFDTKSLNCELYPNAIFITPCSNY
jgi:hypothetical protein